LLEPSSTGQKQLSSAITPTADHVLDLDVQYDAAMALMVLLPPLSQPPHLPAMFGGVHLVGFAKLIERPRHRPI
jgi:hypothetical protein